MAVLVDGDDVLHIEPERPQRLQGLAAEGHHPAQGAIERHRLPGRVGDFEGFPVPVRIDPGSIPDIGPGEAAGAAHVSRIKVGEGRRCVLGAGEDLVAVGVAGDAVTRRGRDRPDNEEEEQKGEEVPPVHRRPPHRPARIRPATAARTAHGEAACCAAEAIGSAPALAAIVSMPSTATCDAAIRPSDPAR
ncbi:hypothetical protein DSECCO2_342700 [anaerobic digester metagenome]